MTPMGLPKPTRMDRTATVSVEDLYLQKNYRTPKTTSALPTIFDENDPKRKKGLVMSKAKRKREIVFQTDPSLRKVPCLLQSNIIQGQIIIENLDKMCFAPNRETIGSNCHYLSLYIFTVFFWNLAPRKK